MNQWETDAWRTENGVGIVKRLLNKLASGGKLSNTMSGKLRSWKHANKYSVVGMDNAYSRAAYDTSMVKSTLANGTDPVQDTLGWQHQEQLMFALLVSEAHYATLAKLPFAGACCPL